MIRSAALAHLAPAMAPLSFLLVSLAFAAEARPAGLERLIATARTERLSERREWRALLHYERAWFGPARSEVDGEDFFLSPSGKTEPEAELEATLAGFFAPSVDESRLENLAVGQHPQCRFRARLAWLDSVLDLRGAGLIDEPCPGFHAWFATLRAASVTVVFASAYINNPASMFGHTLLRLDRARRALGNDLLAYSVNFSAEPTTANPLFYALLGLTGGFAGRFSTIPYYLKVKEYGDFENRDLWEYALDLEPFEVDRLLMHLWEIGPSRLDYYYFDENCSYQLLKALEAAVSRLHLTDHLHGFVIPSDTVRALLAEPGLVARTTFRPSRYSVMLARRQALSDGERRDALDVARDTPLEGLERLAPERQRAVLDTAAELVAYRKKEERDAGVERKILALRRHLGLGPSDPVIAPGAPPEAGHGTSLVAAGAGWSRVGRAAPQAGPVEATYMTLVARPALHDLLAAQAGYAETSEIELLRLEVRAPLERGPLRLERLDFVRIVALAPIDLWAPRLSWRVDGAFFRPTPGAGSVDRGLAFGLLGGPGISGRFSRAVDLVGYAFLDAELAAGSDFDHAFRARGGATAGALAQPISGLRMQVEASYAFPFVGEGRTRPLPGGSRGASLRLAASAAVSLARDLELRAPLAFEPGYLEGSLLVMLYF